MNTAMRFLAAPDPGTFKSDVAKKLGPILGRFAALELVCIILPIHGTLRRTEACSQDDESLGVDWQASQVYIEIMSRRLRDTVELHDQDRGDMNGERNEMDDGA